MIDYSKLNTSMSDWENSIINKDIYKINKKWTNDNRNILIKENIKIIDFVK